MSDKVVWKEGRYEVGDFVLETTSGKKEVMWRLFFMGKLKKWGNEFSLKEAQQAAESALEKIYKDLDKVFGITDGQIEKMADLMATMAWQDRFTGKSQYGCANLKDEFAAIIRKHLKGE